jgi:hypothetical protein
LNHPPEWVQLSTLYVYATKFTRPPSTNKPKICQRRSASRLWEVVSPYLNH